MMYFAGRDAYCLWVVWSHLGVLELNHFCALLTGVAAFILFTDYLAASPRPKRSLLVWLGVTFMVWVLGASLVKRPFAFFSLSTLLYALIKEVEFNFHSFASLLRAIHTLSVLIGGTIGAAFVPLDWAEPWQQFPGPVAVGLLFGSVIGRALEMIVSRLFFKD